MSQLLFIVVPSIHRPTCLGVEAGNCPLLLSKLGQMALSVCVCVGGGGGGATL